MSAYASPAAYPLVLADLVAAGSRARDVALVVGGAGFVGVCAQVSFPVPGTPVPLTLQTFAVLLAGAALGWQRGILSMGLYVVVGSIGVPWFAAGSSGLGGPSYGYLVGFVLAAAVVGRFAGTGADRTPIRAFALMVLGSGVIYAVGATWLAVVLDVGPLLAFQYGVEPFLVGDAYKALLAAGLLPGAWQLVGRQSRPDST